MVKQGVPPTNGWLGSTTCPIQQLASTQSIPWPPSCSLTTSTSILDPPWAMPTQHLQGWPASTCLRPNDLETFRHAQGCPDSSSYTQTPQVHPDHLRSLQITHRSPTVPAAVQELLKCLEMLKLENSGDSDANQVTQYRGLGPPSWLTPTPRYVAHVCYLTTRKAPPEMPCRTTLIWIRRPEWMVHPRGWRFQVEPQYTPRKPRENWKTSWKTLD